MTTNPAVDEPRIPVVWVFRFVQARPNAECELLPLSRAPHGLLEKCHCNLPLNRSGKAPQRFRVPLTTPESDLVLPWTIPFPLAEALRADRDVPLARVGGHPVSTAAPDGTVRSRHPFEFEPATHNESRTLH